MDKQVETGFRVMIGGDILQIIDADTYPSIGEAREAAHGLAISESNKTPSKTFSVVPFGERLRAHGAFGRG